MSQMEQMEQMEHQHAVFRPDDSELSGLLQSLIPLGLTWTVEETDGASKGVAVYDLVSFDRPDMFLFASVSNGAKHTETVISVLNGYGTFRLKTKAKQPRPRPPPHASAQIRSDYFACKVARLQQWQTASQPQQSYVLVLDGRLRNVYALIAAGKPPGCIVVIERCATVALYQQLLVASDPILSGVHVLWSGMIKGARGIEDWVVYDLFRQHNIICKDLLQYVVGVYMDACGDLPLTLPIMMNKFPRAQIYGIAQGFRNRKCPYAFDQPLEGFCMMQRYQQTAVDSAFYCRKDLVAHLQGVEDEIGVVERLLGHRDSEDGGSQFLVKWKHQQGVHSTSWEPEDNICDEQLIRNYFLQSVVVMTKEA
jgi:hypothetical protein